MFKGTRIEGSFAWNGSGDTIVTFDAVSIVRAGMTELIRFICLSAWLDIRPAYA
jgi:hypothetical protein